MFAMIFDVTSEPKDFNLSMIPERAFCPSSVSRDNRFCPKDKRIS